MEIVRPRAAMMGSKRKPGSAKRAMTAWAILRRQSIVTAESVRFGETGRMMENARQLVDRKDW